MGNTTDQYRAQEVSAIFQIGEAQIPINRFVISHTIDELPVVDISVQLDNQNSTNGETRNLGSVDIDLAKITSLSRVTQEKIMNAFRVDPDTQLYIRDGEGHELLFKGFLGKPRFQMREGDVLFNFSIVHAKAVLQGFNTRIYGIQDLYVAPLTSIFLKSSEGKKALEGVSISERLRIIVDELITHVVFQENLIGNSVFDSLPVHNLNLLLLEKVRDVLRLSNTTTEIDGINSAAFQDDNLLWCLYELIINQSNFFHVLEALNKMFLFQMNAEYSGDIWLEWQQQNTPPGNRVIVAPLHNVSFSMAHVYELPILQIMVQGSGNQYYTLHSEFSAQQGQAPNVPMTTDATYRISNAVQDFRDVGVQLTALVKYPPSIPRNAVGTIYILEAPKWINVDMLSTGIISKIEQIDQDKSRNDAVVAQIETIDKTLKENEDVRQRLLTYVAKQQFKSMLLGGTTGSVTIPLNLQVRPGYPYTVTSTTGDVLFVGYLQNVTHDVNISAEGGAAALTTLNFTHITVQGAVINVLQDPPVVPTATTLIVEKPNKQNTDYNLGTPISSPITGNSVEFA